MAITRRAVPADEQATDTTIRATTTSPGNSGNVVPETPPEPTGESQVGVEQINLTFEEDPNGQLDDDHVSLYDATPPPSDAGVEDEELANEQPAVGDLLPISAIPDALQEQLRIDAKIAEIKNARHLASSKLELARLEDEEARAYYYPTLYLRLGCYSISPATVYPIHSHFLTLT